MTDMAVSMIIKLKVGDVSESIEKKISIMDMETELTKAFHQGELQATTILFDLLESQLHRYICTHTGWKNIGTDKRCILTKTGHITYRRHIYRDEQGHRRKPFDELLHLQPWQRNSNQIEGLAAGLASRIGFRDAAEIFSLIVKDSVSPSTIHRMTARVGQKIQAMEQTMDEENLEPGTVVTRRLMAEADGVVIKLQGEQQKRAEVKVAVFYTDKKAISPHRNRLVNKVFSCQLGMSNEKWQQHLAALAYRSYDLSKVEFVQIGGDGAKWVHNSFDHLGIPGHHLLDRFHVIRSLKTAFGNDLNMNELLTNLFSHGFAAIEADLSQVIAHQKGSRKDQQKRSFDYLKANQDALIDLNKRGLGKPDFCTMGVMEGNVDKLVAQRMKGKGRSWRIKGAQNLLAILRYRELIKTEAFAFLEMPKTEPKSRWKYQRYKAPDWMPGSVSVPLFSSTHASDSWLQLLKSKVKDKLSITGFF